MVVEGSADRSQSARPRSEEEHRALLPVLPLLDAWLCEELAIPKPVTRRAQRVWLARHLLQSGYSGRGPGIENDADQPGHAPGQRDATQCPSSQPSDAGPQSRCHALGLRRLHAAPLKHSAIGEYPTVVTASESIISDLEAFAPGALRRNRAGTDQPCTLEGVGKCRHNNDLEWCGLQDS